MTRRTLIWHIGLAHAARPVVAANLEVHGAALAAAGVHVAASSSEVDRATHELLRTHHDAGLSRRDVEGTWARICDRVWEHKGVSLLSTPELCLADKDQLRLALDPLIGVEVHLVVTMESFSEQVYGAWLAELRSGRTTGWDKYAGRVLAPEPGHRQAERFRAGHDLGAVLGRWGWTLRSERVHVLADRAVEQHWLGLLDIAAVPSGGLDPVVPAYADPAGVAVLRRVNRQVEEPLGRGTHELLVTGSEEVAPMPRTATTTLAELAEGWDRLLAEAGHDVRGSVADLVDEGPDTPLPGPRDQLGVAVDALAESLGEVSRLRERVAVLEGERARLDRKRRKLKRRLARAAPSRKK